jgi:hypothetical protein
LGLDIFSQFEFIACHNPFPFQREVRIIDDQANLQFGHFAIANHLGFLKIGNGFDGFVVNNDFVFNNNGIRDLSFLIRVIRAIRC